MQPAARSHWRQPGCCLALRCALLCSLMCALVHSGGALAAPTDLNVAPASEPAKVAATLRVGNRNVLVLRATLGGATPAQRVQESLRRIDELPDPALRQAPQIKQISVGNQTGVAVLVGAMPLFALMETDLDPLAGQKLPEATAIAVKNLSEGLEVVYTQRSPQTMLRGLLLSALATVVFVISAWSILHLKARLRLRMANYAQRKLQRLHVRGIDISAQVVYFLGRMTTLALWLAVFLIAYVWITYVLRRFPFTEPWGDALAVNVVHLLRNFARSAIYGVPGLLVAIVVLMLAHLITQLITIFFQSVEEEKISVHFMYPDTARATRWLLVALTWLLALAIAYPYIPGSDSAAFQGISVITGLMVTLGSAGIVNQAMSGLVLVYSRALTQGEYVKIDEVEGVVRQVGLLSTKIDTHQNDQVTIPNAVVVGSKIRNCSRLALEKGATISTVVSIGYDVSWRQVAALLIAAARNTPGIRQDIAPRVKQRELADFYVRYELIAGIEQPDHRTEVLDLLLGQILDQFNTYGIQIMSPAFESQPERKVVVPREAWYAAPAVPEAAPEANLGPHEASTGSPLHPPDESHRPDSL